jgi:hypothetical protein
LGDCFDEDVEIRPGSVPSNILKESDSGDDHKPKHTIYELITTSKYTTKFAELVKNDTELVDILNKTDATLTAFVPTDAAFKKIPKHVPLPSKKILRRIILNHISGEFYPFGKLLTTYTIPTLLEEKSLGGSQRLVVKGGVHLSLNYFSRIIGANIVSFPARSMIVSGAFAYTRSVRLKRGYTRSEQYCFHASPDLSHR